MLQSAMKSMGGLGKNAKINKSALNRLMKQSESKEKMHQKPTNVNKKYYAKKKKREKKCLKEFENKIV